MTHSQKRRQVLLRLIIHVYGHSFYHQHQCLICMSLFKLHLGKSNDWGIDAIIRHAKSLYFDRHKDISEFPQMYSLLKSTHFHTVIDFSAYSPSDVKRLLPHLQTRLYVYISSDSVYEVCIKADRGTPTVETDAVRPNDPSLAERLKRKDKYGHKKLRCEEYIRKHCDANNLKYIILRLADVIGPRDGTERWWQYQLWIQACVELLLPIFVPVSLQHRQLSFVYVKDIAGLIKDLVDRSDESSQVFNQAYNLACRETPTLAGLLHKMCACLDSSDNRQASTMKVVGMDGAPQIYPSVEKGAIDISKAERLLKWKPSSIDDVIRETVAFYQHVAASDDFEDERKSIMDTMRDDIKDIEHYSRHNVKDMRAFFGRTLVRHVIN